MEEGTKREEDGEFKTFNGPNVEVKRDEAEESVSLQKPDRDLLAELSQLIEQTSALILQVRPIPETNPNVTVAKEVIRGLNDQISLIKEENAATRIVLQKSELRNHRLQETLENERKQSHQLSSQKRKLENEVLELRKDKQDNSRNQIERERFVKQMEEKLHKLRSKGIENLHIELERSQEQTKEANEALRQERANSKSLTRDLENVVLRMRQLEALLSDFAESEAMINQVQSIKTERDELHQEIVEVKDLMQQTRAERDRFRDENYRFENSNRKLSEEMDTLRKELDSSECC